ncbi:MAG: flippase [Chloroflexi bacterium]|nr:flippase [Chloroflexota bacterium]OJW03417.1 MAG: hypothetical protein BGO39_10435 [Chloroflexi bacterium 54-19]
MPNPEQNIRRNLLFNFTGQIILKLLSFLFTITIVRQLGTSNFGTYSTVVAFVGIFAVFSELGINNYAVREIAKDHNQAARLFANMVAIRLVFGILVLVIETGLAWVLGYSTLVIGLIAFTNITIFIYAVQGPLQTILEGFERYDLTAVFNIVYQLVFIGTGALFLLAGFGVPGVIGASFCGALALTFVSYRAARRFTRLSSKIEFRSWLPLILFGLPFCITTFATLVSFKVDTVLLSLWRLPTEVGWYSVAYNLVFTLLSLFLSFTGALVPSLSRKYQEDPAAVTRFFLGSVRYLWMLGLPIAVGTTFIAERLIVLLYGEPYAPAGMVLQILIWVLPVLVLTTLCGAVTTVFHLERKTARINIINATFNILLNLWAIQNYGLLGAAFMTVATEVLGLAQFMVLLRGHLAVSRVVIELLHPIIPVIFMASLLILLGELTVFLEIPLAGGFYLLVLVLTGGLPFTVVKRVFQMVIARFAFRRLATK